MDKKVLLLDFDGVISPGRYFSEIYAEEFNVDINKILPFFEEIKESANIGKADLKDLLVNRLSEWEWKGSVDELLEYWFNSDTDIDNRIKDLVIELRNSGIPVYLATDQEKYKADFIWEKRFLNTWLDGKFVSHEVGFHKSDTRFFKAIINQLDLKPDKIVFFDDSQSKVDSALKSGISAHLYTEFDSFKNIIKATFN